jgi:hypothetical protein
MKEILLNFSEEKFYEVIVVDTLSILTLLFMLNKILSMFIIYYTTHLYNTLLCSINIVFLIEST